MSVSYFVKVVVNNFSEVDQHILLNLNFRRFIDLYSRSVNNTKITDEISTILAHNHELGLPKFFVIWNLVVISITFSNFENSKVSIKRNLKILDFFGINSLEVQMKFVSCGLVWNY